MYKKRLMTHIWNTLSTFKGTVSSRCVQTCEVTTPRAISSCKHGGGVDRPWKIMGRKSLYAAWTWCYPIVIVALAWLTKLHRKFRHVVLSFRLIIICDCNWFHIRNGWWLSVSIILYLGDDGRSYDFPNASEIILRKMVKWIIATHKN